MINETQNDGHVPGTTGNNPKRKPLRELRHFVDRHHGIYTYQVFAARVPFTNLENITMYLYEALLAGPTHELYFEAATYLETVIITEDDGQRWAVHINQDIYLYPEGIHTLINFDLLSDN